MQEQIEMIKKHLTEIGEELFKKYGTDSYEIRCMIYDVKDSVNKLHQPTVISSSSKEDGNKEDGIPSSIFDFVTDL